MRQVNLTMTDEEYSDLIKETGRRQAETGIVYKPTTVAMNILREVLSNGHDPIRVSPPDVETKSQDDSQNVTEDAEMGKQPGLINLNKDKSNLFNFTDIDF